MLDIASIYPRFYTDDIEKSNFPKRFKMEKYAYRLAFYNSHLNVPNGADIMFSMYNKTLEQVNSNFSRIDAAKIIARAEQLQDKERDKEIEMLQRKISIGANVAASLLNEARKHKIDSSICNILVEKDIWLTCQDKNRRIWETLKNKDKLHESQVKYLQFLYDSFPAGFHNEFVETKDRYGVYYPGEILYRIIHNEPKIF